MDGRRSRYALLQAFFGLLLVLSLVVLLFSLLPRPLGPSGSILGRPAGTIDLLAAIASLLAAVTSLAGLAWTTFIGLRQDRREAQAAELERERCELEIEKLKRELKDLRSNKPS
jgi:hypothetical protein